MTTPEQKEQLRRDVFAEVFDMLRHVASREPHRESLDTKALIAKVKQRIERYQKFHEVCVVCSNKRFYSCAECQRGYADSDLLTDILVALTSTGRAPEGETPAPDVTTPGTEPRPSS